MSLSSDSSLEGTHPVSNGTSKANLDLTHESSVATSKGYPLLPTHDISTHEPSSCGIDTQNSTEHLSEGTSKAFNVSQNLSSNVTCDLTPHEHTRKSLSLQVSLTSDESVHEIPSDTRDLTNREFVDNHANVLEGLEGKIRDLSIQPGRESSLLKSLEQKREECQTTKRRDNRSLQVSLEDSDDTPNTRKTLENEDLAEDPENSWVDDNDLVRFNEEKVQSKLVRKDEPSSSDDDAFENYLLQMKQKRKEEEKAIQEDSEDDLDKFIVDDFDVEEDGSEDESKEEEEEEDDPDSNYEEEFSEEEEEEVWAQTYQNKRKITSIGTIFLFIFRMKKAQHRLPTGEKTPEVVPLRKSLPF